MQRETLPTRRVRGDTRGAASHGERETSRVDIESVTLKGDKGFSEMWKGDPAEYDDAEHCPYDGRLLLVAIQGR